MKVKFEHHQHPHIEDRKYTGPTKVKDGSVGINGTIAIWLTRVVGTMWCAYLFAVLALLVLPDAIHGGLLTLIQWVSQTFIQLVMLSVIMVGQNLLGKASDERADMTYKDADATFHEAKEIQNHLLKQDEAIQAILDRLEKREAELDKRTEGQ